MNFNHGQPLSSKLFRWSEGVGFATKADLGAAFKLHQIWADRDELGFTIKSERTGQLKTFVEYRATKAHREVVARVYVSLDQSGVIDIGRTTMWVTIYS